MWKCYSILSTFFATDFRLPYPCPCNLTWLINSNLVEVTDFSSQLGIKNIKQNHVISLVFEKHNGLYEELKYDFLGICAANTYTESKHIK